MDIVLDVAFVIAVTAFLKEQLAVKGKAVLFWAFAIALIFGFAPLIAAMLPPIAPFLEVLLRTFVLFLGAAGSYDFIAGITRRKAR